MHAAKVIPFKFDASEVRTLLLDDQPWFVAADVSAALEYSVPSAMTRHLDDDEKGVSIVHTLGGDQEMLIINESGLYSAILRSRKAEAKRFKKWVTAEVLPAIRKTGSYTVPTATLTPAQQRHIQNRVAELAGAPGNSFASVYRSIKDQFQVGTYKDIPAASYPALCRHLLCKPLEGELLEAEQPKSLDLHYPASWLAEHNPHLRTHAFREPGIHLTASGLCGMDARSPSLAMTAELTRAGYDVSACRMEIMAMRNQIERYIDLCRKLSTLADSHQYGGIIYKLSDDGRPLR